MTLSDYLTKRSDEICQDNSCEEDSHHCESYAYISRDGQLLDICAADYFQGSSNSYAAISLPWIGTQLELEEEIEEQCWNEIDQEC